MNQNSQDAEVQQQEELTLNDIMATLLLRSHHQLKVSRKEWKSWTYYSKK